MPLERGIVKTVLFIVTSHENNQAHKRDENDRRHDNYLRLKPIRRNANLSESEAERILSACLDETDNLVKSLSSRRLSKNAKANA